jgi:Paraquat-inducible protein A
VSIFSPPSPDVAFLPSDFYSLDLLVAPKWGLYANLTAQIISQISSHFIIHFHRRMIEKALKADQVVPDLVHTATALIDEEGNEHENVTNTTPGKFISMIQDSSELWKGQLCSHAFRRPHRGESDKLVIRRFVSPLLVLLAMCCTVLVILGCILPSYSVRALGIVGILVESGQKFSAADTKYSAFTTITLLFEQASLTGNAADLVGLGSLSLILLLSVLVAPIAQSLFLLVQWFTPLSKKRRKRLMILLEILQAWQYAEVYLLAILVGSWQLGPISGKQWPFRRRVLQSFSKQLLTLSSLCSQPS